MRTASAVLKNRSNNATSALDLGCGRGEMLEVFREAGISARGVDLHEESRPLCAAKGLGAEKADLLQYLDSLPDSSLGGVICAQGVREDFFGALDYTVFARKL